MSEKRKPTNLEQTIAFSIEKAPLVTLTLSALEVAEVIQLLSQNLLEKNGASGITFEEVAVHINNKQAKVAITVSISRPVSATFDISYILTNSHITSGELQTSNVEVAITANRLSLLALKAMNVKKQVISILDNLNETLIENPPPIVADHGYHFTGVHLTLENDHLAVQLSSTKQ